jgi:hypothetical protein
MSLDVYLNTPGITHQIDRSPKIFIRRNGQQQEISRAEWDKLNPGIEPVTFTPDREETDRVYRANITHNLGAMAAAAGIYEALWEPEEIGITTAAQLIVPLKEAHNTLSQDPSKFEAFNPENGYGDFSVLRNFVLKYWEACVLYPEAIVSVCR